MPVCVCWAYTLLLAPPLLLLLWLGDCCNAVLLLLPLYGLGDCCAYSCWFELGRGGCCCCWVCRFGDCGTCAGGCIGAVVAPVLVDVPLAFVTLVALAELAWVVVWPPYSCWPEYPLQLSERGGTLFTRGYPGMSFPDVCLASCRLNWSAACGLWDTTVAGPVETWPAYVTVGANETLCSDTWLMGVIWLV